jgi:cytoplasmic iron level regulating protein YaaA (DUF328/UPF0246 family)
VAARSLILLPPSEGKAPGGDGPPWSPGTMAVAELDPARQQVLAALGRTHPAAIEPTCAAIERYTGVLYRELDAASLRGTARTRLRRDVRIVSGLWGLVAPADPIPDYRLKMSARVEPLGRMAAWWKPQLTEALAPQVRGAVVWDLLPNEHAAAVDWTVLAPRRRITVRFVDADDRTVSHWNKLLKGSIVRWLLETGSRDPFELAELDHPQGYRLDPGATVDDGSTLALVLRAPG